MCGRAAQQNRESVRLRNAGFVEVTISMKRTHSDRWPPSLGAHRRRGSRGSYRRVHPNADLHLSRLGPPNTRHVRRTVGSRRLSFRGRRADDLEPCGRRILRRTLVHCRRLSGRRSSTPTGRALWLHCRSPTWVAPRCCPGSLSTELPTEPRASYTASSNRTEDRSSSIGLLSCTVGSGMVGRPIRCVHRIP